ncbi:hypothetical protein Purlil1_2474 [Purpureocillium lilacinum]|uniref:Uncharacterized protein n=1 Tax=Purpureocillium lilacinum TaxID=33203 RepID=A0ABR0CAL5_PURLI|nr:hypothetical protein Purlil1_2474 [Purpureocillium lilacinum]
MDSQAWCTAACHCKRGDGKGRGAGRVAWPPQPRKPLASSPGHPSELLTEQNGSFDALAANTSAHHLCRRGGRTRGSRGGSVLGRLRRCHWDTTWALAAVGASPFTGHPSGPFGAKPGGLSEPLAASHAIFQASWQGVLGPAAAPGHGGLGDMQRFPPAWWTGGTLAHSNKVPLLQAFGGLGWDKPRTSGRDGGSSDFGKDSSGEDQESKRATQTRTPGQMDGDRPAVVRVELCRQDHADADADAAADANANAGRGRKGWLVACKEHSMSTTIDRESPPHAVGPETDNGSLGLLAKSYLDVVSPHLQRSDFGIAMVQLLWRNTVEQLHATVVIEAYHGSLVTGDELLGRPARQMRFQGLEALGSKASSRHKDNGGGNGGNGPQPPLGFGGPASLGRRKEWSLAQVAIVLTPHGQLATPFRSMPDVQRRLQEKWTAGERPVALNRADKAPAITSKAAPTVSLVEEQWIVGRQAALDWHFDGEEEAAVLSSLMSGGWCQAQFSDDPAPPLSYEGRDEVGAADDITGVLGQMRREHPLRKAAIGIVQRAGQMIGYKKINQRPSKAGTILQGRQPMLAWPGWRAQD